MFYFIFFSYLEGTNWTIIVFYVFMYEINLENEFVHILSHLFKKKKLQKTFPLKTLILLDFLKLNIFLNFDKKIVF